MLIRLLTLSLISMGAQAAVYEWPAAQIPKLVIVATDAQIVIKGTAAASVKLSSSDSGEELGLERGDQSVVLRPLAPSSKSDFAKPSSGRKIIEIEGASVPLEIHLFDGSVTMTQWKKDAYVHLHKGKFMAREGQADLSVHLLKGDISVWDHAGGLNIDGYQVAVSVKNSGGDFSIFNFAGDTSTEKTKGPLRVQSVQGTAKIQSGTGSLQFEMGKGTLNAQSFQGRVEGQSSEGLVQITMAKQSDVSVRTQAGKVVVTSPPGSGAYMNLWTVGGDIYIPSSLKVNRDVSGKSFHGRLLGAEQKGTISVRSQDGHILVK